ncbi:RNA methyltransferase tRNA(m5U54)methyltransferase [Lobosporangium transversale]|uniref:tRNA (guanine(26)-N(2))-dimethyltransferase n=1 Tax=Lobosporangium transversale TaxID=64571 RepID=A0A1Y2H3A1_9FUNG|nr:N2,N2-dimethylguanosine tRNA methyltransferase-domain-containing protein [Lobosporangium transversale]KAF9914154.1 RNA methyltransferase tRNA(m5U54)methyltransferase [Lobosporangium transversale]ORZ28471.1 N2,N2-dimethylguanosine tRNA methyltransferase-domain-containing protein [Lobosporangium transversale]|eukprot:XP_021886156.1 N2,N2-dimethylguanosine tRNA methyltransferase-domain-containing protein [Lobosporangium transversale]
MSFGSLTSRSSFPFWIISVTKKTGFPLPQLFGKLSVKAAQLSRVSLTPAQRHSRGFSVRTATSGFYATVPLTKHHGMADMDSAPAPAGFTKVTEGKATILFPDTNEVFYNPIQQFNRDISIAAIRTWDEIFQEERAAKRAEKQARKEAAAAKRAQEGLEPLPEREFPQGAVDPTAPRGITILEALSASGLRSIRYAKEIPNVKHILTNDLEADAVASIKRNAEFNGISSDLLEPHQGDAIDVLYQHRDPLKRYDVIDLDPYGTASPFIDGAVQAVSDGGLLCVTCTDLGVLAGSNYTETCYAKYGGHPVKAEFCHEVALRLVLNTLSASAARYKRHIVPMVSLSIDYYLRVFVRVYSSAAEVKMTASKTCLAYVCSGCQSSYTQSLGKVSENAKGNKKFGVNTGPPVNQTCEHCGSRFHVAGPMWGKELHSVAFIERMLNHVKGATALYQTQPRILGMLTVCKEEIETPFYYTANGLSGTIHCTSIPLLNVVSALLHDGYRVSGSHAAQGSIKTDAPSSAVWDVMRSWVKLNPVKNIKPDSPAGRILAVEPKKIANFEMHPDARSESRKANLVRYQMNPTKNWGPQARAGSNKRKAQDNESELVEKSVKLENNSTDDAKITAEEKDIA